MPSLPPLPRAKSGSNAESGAPAAPSSGAGAGRAGSNFDADKAATEASELARGIFARARNILLTPSTEWPVIAAEPSSSGAIYLRYVAPLVAIGVIATFLGQTLVGTSAGPLGMVRVGIFAGLMHAILLFGLSFLQVFLISWLVDALAPSFGGQPNSLAALKVTAYSFTPGWIAAVLNVVPVLGVIGVLAALYGLYLLYLGLPVLMRSPKDRSVGYTVVLVICAVVLSVLVTTLSTCAVAGLDFLGLGALARHGGVSNAATAKTDTAGVLANIFGGKSDAAAMNAVGQIMAGGKDVQPIDFRELRAMLPASLPGMQRNEASGQGGEAMGMKGSSATARYSDGAKAAYASTSSTWAPWPASRRSPASSIPTSRRKPIRATNAPSASKGSSCMNATTAVRKAAKSVCSSRTDSASPSRVRVSTRPR